MNYYRSGIFSNDIYFVRGKYKINFYFNSDISKFTISYYTGYTMYHSSDKIEITKEEFERDFYNLVKTVKNPIVNKTIIDLYETMSK